jgi:hypothetical protein
MAEIYAVEMALIRQHRSNNPEIGYNRSPPLAGSDVSGLPNPGTGPSPDMTQPGVPPGGLSVEAQ